MKKLLLVLLLTFNAQANELPEVSVIESPCYGNKDTYLLIGQSNMSFMIRDVPDISEVLGSKDCPVNVVNVSLAGMDANWFRPSYDKTSSFYRGYQAIKKLNKRITHIVVNQGEGDSKKVTDAKQWTIKWANILGAYRQMAGTPTTPVLIVGLHPASLTAWTNDKNNVPGWDIVASQQKLLANILPNVKIVPVNGLFWQYKGTHLRDAREYRKLAERVSFYAKQNE